MTNHLLYISKNNQCPKDLEDMIKSLGATIKLIAPSDFMVEIFTNKAILVLVDLDSLSERGVTAIEAVLEDDYVQTLYIYEHYQQKWEGITVNGLLISHERCLLILKDFLMHARISNLHFSKISSNYETMKLIDEEFDNILNAYMKALKVNEPKIIDNFLSLVYSNNFMTNQIPKWFVMVHQRETFIETYIFGNNQEEITYISDEGYLMDEFLQKASEAGLYVNFSANTLSDISSIDEIMPNFLIDYFEENFHGFHIKMVKNMTTFAINNTLFIGLDYQEPLAGYDLSVFKGVCDKINKLHLVKSNINDLHEAFIYTMDALARAAESKDDITGHHIKRVNDYSALIAKEIGMDDGFVNDIQIAAQMHDVGKISISENILNKPGKLSDDEFYEMKRHTTYGAAIIGDSVNLNMAKIIAQSHHEKFDGSGYPEGLRGEEIPIAARIVSLADIYDALRSKRSYKEGFSHDKAYEIITVGDGRVMPQHFDPEVLNAFKRVHEVMKYIYDANVD